MGYVKKKFEGKYQDWYNKISANKGLVPEKVEYSPVGNSVSSLDWQGENKTAICNTVSIIDEACNTLANSLSSNVDKVNICTGTLYSNLESLKNKIDEYNGYIDEYNTAVAELKKQENSSEES